MGLLKDRAALYSIAAVHLWRRQRRALRERSSPLFVDAYVTGIARRVPMLYLVVLFDVALLDASFHAVAPLAVQATGVVLALVGGLRGRAWMPRRMAAMSLDQKRAALVRISRVGGLLALAFMTWAVDLSFYGSAEQSMLVHYVLAVTSFAAIVALAQSPRTALYVALSFSVTATVVFVASHNDDAIQLALVQSVLTATMMIAILTNHREFVRRELNGQRLARRLAHTARESRVNYYRATIDDLTEVLNRGAILQRLRDDLIATSGARLWLALADLDGFKHVNDTYGHAAGDAVLRAVATRIGPQAGVKAYGRLGGDEFAILFDRTFDQAQVRAASRALSDAVSQPIAFNGTQLRVLCSIGLYRSERVAGHAYTSPAQASPAQASPAQASPAQASPAQASPAETSDCLERADAALYKAKQQGGGAVVVFGTDDEAAHRQRAEITRQFHDSVLEDRLRLVYQPVIDTRDGRIVGAEAFARWSPDGRTWQAPAKFLEMAHATGRMGEVTRLVLTRALMECRPADNGIALSINLSPRDVLRDGVAETLANITADAGGSPFDLILEVTERALIDDPRRATRQLEALREHGFRIALDDFGAGWSSLSQLRDLPLDLIKLHGALAEALPGDPGARAVAGMIVALTWQLGLGCTIKGIETEAQAQAARALGITCMQGYHFGAPDSAAIMLAGIKRAVA